MKNAKIWRKMNTIIRRIIILKPKGESRIYIKIQCKWKGSNEAKRLQSKGHNQNNGFDWWVAVNTITWQSNSGQYIHDFWNWFRIKFLSPFLLGQYHHPVISIAILVPNLQELIIFLQIKQPIFSGDHNYFS